MLNSISSILPFAKVSVLIAQSKQKLSQKAELNLLNLTSVRIMHFAEKLFLRYTKKFKIKLLICAVQRGNEVYIPNGDFVIESGDKLHITASHRDVAKFMREIGVINTKVKTAIIIGGGRISFYLAKQLLESGIRVKIIEHNMNRCKELTEHLPKADIVCADGTDKHVLAQEGIDRVDSLVALTCIDEENMIISMYSQSRFVDKIVTKVNRLSFAELMENTGVYSIVTPKKHNRKYYNRFTQER